MSRTIMRGPRGFGRVVEGEAFVSSGGFSARYDLDPATGIISRESHTLYGESIVDRILIFSTAKGGVATSWRLPDLVHRGVGPAGLVFGELNPVMVQGAVLAGVPIVHGLEPDPVTAVRFGDWVRLDPDAGTLEVLEGGDH